MSMNQALLLSLALVAPAARAAANEATTVSADALSPDQLVFEDAAAGARYRAVHADLAAAHASWRHLPLRPIGNFLTERWCSPVVPERDCLVGRAADGTERGRAWAELSALHYPADLPQAFGMSLHTGAIPEEGAWGARLSLVQDGRRILGGGLQITLLHLSDGADGAVEELHLGSSLSWDVADSHLSVDDPGGTDDDALLALLKRMADSPDALAKIGTAQLDALQAEVLRALAAGEVQRCEYGPYEGRGIPPECTLVPLSDEQRAEEEARVTDTLGHQRTLLQQRAAAAHAALVAVVPAALR